MLFFSPKKKLLSKQTIELSSNLYSLAQMIFYNILSCVYVAQQTSVTHKLWLGEVCLLSISCYNILTTSNFITDVATLTSSLKLTIFQNAQCTSFFHSNHSLKPWLNGFVTPTVGLSGKYPQFWPRVQGSKSTWVTYLRY